MEKSLVLKLAEAIRDFEMKSTSSGFVQNLLNEMCSAKFFFKCREAEKSIFISSLSKLLTIVDCDSPLAWSVLTILESFCKASNEEEGLVYFQRLAPEVFKFILSPIPEDSKVRLLEILQALTCGIEIPRADSFIAPAIARLVEWATAGGPSTVTQLSLAVLINLVHRNPVVLTILQRTINLKEVMNNLLLSRSDVSCKMEVYQFMFLVKDVIYERPFEGEITNFIKVSCSTVREMSRQANKSHLQHCIQFFYDMVKQKKITCPNLDQPWFLECIEKIICQLETSPDSINPQCSMLLFKFLTIFVEMKVPSFSTYYERLMKQGVTWVMNFKNQAVEAINTIQAILKTEGRSSHSKGLESKDFEVVFLPLLEDHISNAGPDVRNNFQFMTLLLSLLCSALDFESYCVTLTQHLKPKMIEVLLNSLPEELHWEEYSFSEPYIKMYTCLLYFVYKVVCCDSSWMKFYNCLFCEQKILSVLAVALCHGSSEMKNKALSLMCSVGFPGESLAVVANIMADCGKKPISGKKDQAFDFKLPPNNTLFVEIKELIRSVSGLLKQTDFMGIAPSQIWQLYKYKEELNLEYEKSLAATISNSIKEKEILREEVQIANEITYNFRQELHNVRQAFDDVKSKYEDSLKSLNEREQEIDRLQENLTQEVSNCKNTVQKLKETVEKQEREILNYSSHFKAMKTQLANEAEKYSALEQEHRKLLQERDALKEDATNQLQQQEKQAIKIASLSQDVERLDKLVATKSTHILQLEQDKIQKEKEIQDLQRIRDTVFEITGGRKRF